MMRTVAILALLALTLAACEKQDKTPPSSPVASDTPAATAPSGPQGTAAGTSVAPGRADAATGEKVYKEVCATCHDQGLAGAPRTGDKEIWKSRIGKGMETLVRNSIQGFKGSQGVMPPKGGVQSLSDGDVAAAVEYMVDKSR